MDRREHEMDDNLDFQLDSDSEDEQEEQQQVRRRGAGVVRDRIPLHHFLRLIAPHRLVEHGAAATNDDLVHNLKRAGALTNDRVAQAMRVCARDMFVVDQYRDEALIDAPIRVEEMDFNISAPHMHATCLEALQLQPGHKVLDVGSGCGVLTAACAYLVGRQGAVVGVDIRRDCVRICKDNVRRLAGTSGEYASTAAPIRFEQHNVFMPTPRHRGQYDRVHVGASCPPDRLQPLVQLLRPEGGMIVVPVAPNDLRLITKKASGAVTQKVISQVRFSDLEVPTDAQILLATLRLERKQRTQAAHMPSTYAQDVAAIARKASGLTPSSSCSESSGCFFPSSSPTAVLDGLPPTPDTERASSWPSRLSKLLASCSGGHKSSASLEDSTPRSPDGMVIDGGDGTLSSPPASPTAARLAPEDLGEPDCTLQGAGWQIPVHRSVLRARCDHFRARCDSGMRDALSSVCAVPDHFSREAVESFLHYAYHDELPEGLDPQAAVGVLHVAQYYGVSRLTHLCEVKLARVLKGAARKGRQQQPQQQDQGGRGGRGFQCLGEDEDDCDDDGVPDAAAALLALADDCGLVHLRAVALDFIVTRFDEVSKTESYAALTREQVDMVAAEGARLYSRMTAVLRDMCATQGMQLPEHSY